MNINMNVNTAIALIYIGLCGAVGFACYITNSAWPLVGLLCAPSVKTSED